MRLIDELEQSICNEPSLFRAQLLREDVARLRRLGELACMAHDIAAFKAAALRIGWTQGDARTHELAGTLDPLLDAVFALRAGAGTDAQETCVLDAWLDFHRQRMERLTGCLSTPVPKPGD
jgi:hypothetical protein